MINIRDGCEISTGLFNPLRFHGSHFSINPVNPVILSENIILRVLEAGGEKICRGGLLTLRGKYAYTHRARMPDAGCRVALVNDERVEPYEDY